MKLNRRQLLAFASLGLATSSAWTTGTHQSANWEIICRTWLDILMPADEYGPGANSKLVWMNLRQLMNDTDFNQGIRAGFNAISKIPLPAEESELTNLLSQSTPESQFLNAFFEIVVESYYGSELGWNDLGIGNTPQPNGFILEKVQ